MMECENHKVNKKSQLKERLVPTFFMVARKEMREEED